MNSRNRDSDAELWGLLEKGLPELQNRMELHRNNRLNTHFGGYGSYMPVFHPESPRFLSPLIEGLQEAQILDDMLQPHPTGEWTPRNFRPTRTEFSILQQWHPYELRNGDLSYRTAAYGFVERASAAPRRTKTGLTTFYKGVSIKSTDAFPILFSLLDHTALPLTNPVGAWKDVEATDALRVYGLMQRNGQSHRLQLTSKGLGHIAEQLVYAVWAPTGTRNHGSSRDDTNYLENSLRFMDFGDEKPITGGFSLKKMLKNVLVSMGKPKHALVLGEDPRIPIEFFLNTSISMRYKNNYANCEYTTFALACIRTRRLLRRQRAVIKAASRLYELLDILSSSRNPQTMRLVYNSAVLDILTELVRPLSSKQTMGYGRANVSRRHYKGSLSSVKYTAAAEVGKTHEYFPRVREALLELVRIMDDVMSFAELPEDASPETPTDVGARPRGRASADSQR